MAADFSASLTSCETRAARAAMLSKESSSALAGGGALVRRRREDAVAVAAVVERKARLFVAALSILEELASSLRLL